MQLTSCHCPLSTVIILEQSKAVSHLYGTKSCRVMMPQSSDVAQLCPHDVM